MKTSVDTSCKERHKAKVGSFTASGKPALHFCLLLFALCLLLSTFSGCGKIGDPLPPIPRAPLIVNELRVEQRGAALILTFPFTRTPRSAGLQRVDIYRLVEPITATAGLTPTEFEAHARLIASIPAEQIPLKSAMITYQDALDLKASDKNVRHRYAVRLVNASGAEAELSNYAMIAPLFDLALAPANVRATQREREIEITWNAPAANESGSTPPNVAAYNIYRRAPGGALAKLNAAPLTDRVYQDRAFQFGWQYEYIVRALSLLPNNTSLANAIESADSAALSHTAKDTFPPAAPVSITIAAANGMISLFWPLNSEPDVAGYNLYRSEDANTPAAGWAKLNPQLHKSASFRDERVQVGKEYFYQLTAIDVYGNESARSATVSELAVQ